MWRRHFLVTIGAALAAPVAHARQVYRISDAEALPPGKGPYYVLKGSSLAVSGVANKPLKSAALAVEGKRLALELVATHRAMADVGQAAVDTRGIPYRRRGGDEPGAEQPYRHFVEKQAERDQRRQAMRDRPGQPHPVKLGILERAQARPIALFGVAQAEYLQRRKTQRQGR